MIDSDEDRPTFSMRRVRLIETFLLQRVFSVAGGCAYGSLEGKLSALVRTVPGCTVAELVNGWRSAMHTLHEQAARARLAEQTERAACTEIAKAAALSAEATR